MAHSALFSLTMEHPCLTETDAALMHTFLSSYNQYVNEIKLRARQITSEVDRKGFRRVDLKFCVDINFLESLTDLGFIDKAA